MAEKNGAGKEQVSDPSVRSRSGDELYCYHSGVAIADHSRCPATLETVFLDRDGVLNEKAPEGKYVTSSSELHPLPGVAEAIRKLNEAGLRVLVVSNQRGVALGLYSAEAVRAIHEEFQKLLERRGARVDAFYFCPHDRGQCTCRKPLSGLFEQAVADFPSIRAEGSAMVGDSLADIEFGRRLGMRTILLEGDPSRQMPGADAARELCDMRFPSLPEAVDALLMDLQSHDAAKSANSQFRK